MTELKAEIPATGILKTHDFGDSKYYKITCECGSPEDMITFSVELSVDAWNIELNTDFTPKTAWWDNLVDQNYGLFKSSWLWSIEYSIRRLINTIYHRCKVTYEVWTNGYVEYSQTTLMSEQQALNYAATINQAIEELRIFRTQDHTKT